MKSISIIIPTYNESKNIILLVKKISYSLKEINWEIIFVDDNSPDKTSQKIHSIKKKYKNIRVIDRIHERGLAGAVIAGLKDCKFSKVVVMDADLQHDPMYIPMLLKKLIDDNATIVIASRYLQESTFEDFHFLRKLGSRVTISIFNFFVQKKISDSMSGFFIIKKNFFLSISPELSLDGYKILADIILSGQRDILISEISLNFKKRNAGKSKMNYRVFWDFLMIIIHSFLKKYIPRKYLSYVCVGILGLSAHIIALYVFYQLFQINFLLSHLIATFIAIFINYILNNLLTFYNNHLSGLGWLMGLLNYYFLCCYGVFISYSITKTLSEFYFHWFFATLIGAFTASIWNFSISKFLIWKDEL